MSLRSPPRPVGFKTDWVSWGVLATSRAQRQAVITKFGMVCGECQRQCAHIEAEHTFPLWLVDRLDYPSCLKYWSIDNLTAICPDCHKPKTRREAVARAKIKRIARKRDGHPKPPRWRGPQRKISRSLRRAFKPTPVKQIN